jgi:hypothetical protein
MCLPLPPPVMPISVSRASPGPLTTQPSTDRLIGVLIWRSAAFQRLDRADHVKALPRTGLGQETIRTPRVRRPSAFRISNPTRTSSSGSADSETRIVSPIPAHSRLPMPIDAFHRAADQPARLGNAQVQRAIDRIGQGCM